MSTPVIVRVTEFDSIDKAILRDRMALLSSRTLPSVGEFVLFKDGTCARISYIFGPDQWNIELQGVCTDFAGSFYLGMDYCEHIGRHYGYAKLADLELADELRPGDVWFRHHGHDNGEKVRRVAMFRVWREKKGENGDESRAI